MWRLIAFIVIFAIFLAFIVFNLENKCDVSVGLKTFEGIPVFLTAFSSFVLGMVFAVPFVLSWGKRRKKNQESAPPEDQMPKPKKRFGRKKEETPSNIERDESFKLADQLKRENSINGIY